MDLPDIHVRTAVGTAKTVSVFAVSREDLPAAIWTRLFVPPSFQQLVWEGENIVTLTVVPPTYDSDTRSPLWIYGFDQGDGFFEFYTGTPLDYAARENRRDILAGLRARGETSIYALAQLLASSTGDVEMEDVISLYRDVSSRPLHEETPSGERDPEVDSYDRQEGRHAFVMTLAILSRRSDIVRFLHSEGVRIPPMAPQYLFDSLRPGRWRMVFSGNRVDCVPPPIPEGIEAVFRTILELEPVSRLEPEGLIALLSRYAYGSSPVADLYARLLSLVADRLAVLPANTIPYTVPIQRTFGDPFLRVTLAPANTVGQLREGLRGVLSTPLYLQKLDTANAVSLDRYPDSTRLLVIVAEKGIPLDAIYTDTMETGLGTPVS